MCPPLGDRRSPYKPLTPLLSDREMRRHRFKLSSSLRVSLKIYKIISHYLENHFIEKKFEDKAVDTTGDKVDNSTVYEIENKTDRCGNKNRK